MLYGAHELFSFPVHALAPGSDSHLAVPSRDSSQTEMAISATPTFCRVGLTSAPSDTTYDSDTNTTLTTEGGRRGGREGGREGGGGRGREGGGGREGGRGGKVKKSAVFSQGRHTTYCAPCGIYIKWSEKIN